MQPTLPLLADPFNPVTPDFLQNPYPYYRVLRERAPVFWSTASNYWLVTRYADVRHCLTNPGFGKRAPLRNDGCPFSRLKSTRIYSFLKELIRQESKRPDESKWLSHQDPPGHTRLRGLLNAPFSIQKVEEMYGRIERLADELLDRVADQGRMDVISDYALPLSTTVIAELLGIPSIDQMRFRSWSLAIVSGFALCPTKAQRATAERAMTECVRYFRPLIAEKKRNPGVNLFTTLVMAEENDGTLTEPELLGNCVLLMVAGHLTTSDFIGNAISALLQNHDQASLLRREEQLIDSAIEELLRFEPSVQVSERFLLEDMTMDDKLMKAGARVLLVIGSANRDPEIFPDPDRLDISRRPNKHLAFSGGIHLCLGAALARTEGRIAVNLLLRRFPEIKLAGTTFEFRLQPRFRGLRSLPVHFKAATLGMTLNSKTGPGPDPVRENSD